MKAWVDSNKSFHCIHSILLTNSKLKWLEELQYRRMVTSAGEKTNKGQRLGKMLKGSFYLLAHPDVHKPWATPRLPLHNVRVHLCVYLSVFSIRISAPVESEPEDPLELIEEHRDEDVTLRRGDKNALSPLSLTLSNTHTHTHPMTQSNVHSYKAWVQISPQAATSCVRPTWAAEMRLVCAHAQWFR